MEMENNSELDFCKSSYIVYILAIDYNYGSSGNITFFIHATMPKLLLGFILGPF